MIRGSTLFVRMEHALFGEAKPTSMISTPRKGFVSDYRLEDTLGAPKKKYQTLILRYNGLATSATSLKY